MRNSDADPAAGWADPLEERLLDVRLRPHRSLTHRHFQVFFLVFTAAAIASSLPFVFLGAWPVGGFMGLDIVLVYAAFRANFRAAQAYEDIVVTPLELVLAKVSPRGSREEWRFNPAWVRLECQEHVEFGLQRLSLISRGDRVEIGRFLGPDAKAQFAHGLTLALGKARRGARYS